LGEKWKLNLCFEKWWLVFSWVFFMET
jgi:hypothetical protein